MWLSPNAPVGRLECFLCCSKRIFDGLSEDNAEQGYSPREVKEYYDGLRAEILAEPDVAKIQNRRTDAPNQLKLEVKLGKYLEAVISSECIDFKGALKNWRC